jgi:hypothetical protein
MEVSDKLHAPATLTPEKNPRTHRIEGSVHTFSRKEKSSWTA